MIRTSVLDIYYWHANIFVGYYDQMMCVLSGRLHTKRLNVEGGLARLKELCSSSYFLLILSPLIPNA